MKAEDNIPLNLENKSFSSFCWRVLQELEFLQEETLCNISSPSKLLSITGSKYDFSKTTEFKEYDSKKNIVHLVNNSCSADSSLIESLNYLELLDCAPLLPDLVKISVYRYKKRYYGPLIGTSLKIAEQINIEISPEKVALNWKQMSSKDSVLRLKILDLIKKVVH